MVLGTSTRKDPGIYHCKITNSILLAETHLCDKITHVYMGERNLIPCYHRMQSS